MDFQIWVLVYIALVVQPVASTVVLLSHRHLSKVLPPHRLGNGQRLDEGPVARFLLTSFCCFGDQLVNTAQARAILVSEIGETTGFFTAFFGAVWGAVVASPDDDDQQGLFWAVLIGAGVVAVVWYFVIKKLVSQSPQDEGYQPQRNQTVAAEMV